MKVCSLFAFAGGVLIGGVAALRFAPKRGDERRKDIMGKIDDVKRQFTESVKVMGVTDNFQNLSKDAQEYLKRSIDDVKMTVVEELSVMVGDIIASLALFLILFVAFLFILVGAVVALALVIGFVPSMAVAGFVLAVLAFVVYSQRARIFTNAIVRHLCRILSVRKEGVDEKWVCLLVARIKGCTEQEPCKKRGASLPNVTPRSGNKEGIFIPAAVGRCGVGNIAARKTLQVRKESRLGVIDHCLKPSILAILSNF